LDGARIEERRHQVEVVGLARELERDPGLPRVPDGAERGHHFPQPGTRGLPLHREAPLVVRLDLVPRPSVKRPPEAAWRSQAMLASTMGLRANATAMAVPSPMREVPVAATARGRNGSCLVSADQSAPKPRSSAFLA